MEEIDYLSYADLDCKRLRTNYDADNQRPGIEFGAIARKTPGFNVQMSKGSEEEGSFGLTASSCHAVADECWKMLCHEMGLVLLLPAYVFCIY